MMQRKRLSADAFWMAWLAFAVLLSCKAATAQLAPNAPPDKPVSVHSNDQAQKLEEAIKPYVEKARKTWPKAKKKFLAGLPRGETFFVTTKIFEDSLHYEVVFIKVTEIKDGRISGQINSDLAIVKKYKTGDEYSFPEKDLLDWTISMPDGSEEGNFVGKFLDSYHPN